MKALILIILFMLSLTAKAEHFYINLKDNEELKNLAALEIELAFEPNSYLIGDEISVDSDFVLFKTVDPSKSTIRIFFDKQVSNSSPTKEINIKGSLLRQNYNGSIKSVIKSIKFISDFAKNINAKDINIKFVVISDPQDKELPYLGISSAKLLGPTERMAFNPMMIAISDVETYGFTFDKSVDEITINGQKAKFISDKIISATVFLENQSTTLPVDLFVRVKGMELRKHIGEIKLIETFQ